MYAHKRTRNLPIKKGYYKNYYINNSILIFAIEKPYQQF